LDRISESNQNYAVFSFNTKQEAGINYKLKDINNKIVLVCTPENDFTNLIISMRGLSEGNYTLWSEYKQLAGASGEGMMRGPGMNGGGMKEMPEGEAPEGMERPDMPRGERPEMPEGMKRPGKNGNVMNNGELSTEFKIKKGGNYFCNISIA